MIEFFHGRELFPVKEAVQKETAVFLSANKSAFVQKFNLEDESQLESFINTLKSKSFFLEEKLIIATKIFFSNKVAEEVYGEIKKYWTSSDRDLNFIFYEQGSATELQKKGQQFFGFLVKNSGNYKEIFAPKGIQLEKWLTEKFKTAGFKIKTPVLRKLVSSVLSQEKLNQEVNKLIAYKNFEKKSEEVSSDDMDRLVVPDNIIFNNFSLTDALAEKNKAKAIRFLNQYLSDGGDAVAVLGLFAYQLRVLLKVKSVLKESTAYGSLAALTKLHPFVIKKAYDNCGNFELEELKRIYKDLSKLDRDFKDSRNDLVSGLFCLLLKIC